MLRCKFLLSLTNGNKNTSTHELLVSFLLFGQMATKKWAREKKENNFERIIPIDWRLKIAFKFYCIVKI